MADYGIQACQYNTVASNRSISMGGAHASSSPSTVLTRSHSSIHSLYMSIGSVSALTVVLKFSWQILQEASPIKFFMSIRHSTLLPWLQNGQEKTVSSLSIRFLGGGLAADFLFPMLQLLFFLGWSKGWGKPEWNDREEEGGGAAFGGRRLLRRSPTPPPKPPSPLCGGSFRGEGASNGTP